MAPRKPSLTLGIEEEYLLVDPRTGELVVEQPSGLMPACKEKLGEHVTHELAGPRIDEEVFLLYPKGERRFAWRHPGLPDMPTGLSPSNSR